MRNCGPGESSCRLPLLSLLSQNLQALATRQPLLAAALESAAAARGVTTRNPDWPTATVTGPKGLVHVASTLDPWVEAQGIVEAQSPISGAPTGSYFVVGHGIGALSRACFARHPNAAVFAFEPDLALLRLSLSIHDFTQELRAGTLFFTELAEPPRFMPPTGAVRIAHPVLAPRYREHLHELQFHAAKPAARGRALVMRYRLFIDDLLPLFEEAGIACRQVDPSGLTSDEIARLVRTHAPDFIFSINFSPELAAIAGELKTRYISWSIDPLPPSRLRLLAGTRPELLHAFAHQHHLVQALQAAGIPRVAYLPLGGAKRRLASPQARPSSPPSFVASSLISEWAGADHALRQKLGSEFFRLATEIERVCFEACDRCDVSGQMLVQGLASQFPMLGMEDHDLLGGALSHRFRMLRGAQLTSQGVELWGDSGWSSLGPAYRGPADHGEQLTKLYGSSVVNIDVPRLYQRDIATMRIFDVLAAGGLLLAEPSPDLLALFTPGVHLLAYRSTAELQAQIALAKTHPAEAEAIRAAGQAEVAQRHLLDHRVRQLLSAAEQDGMHLNN